MNHDHPAFRLRPVRGYRYRRDVWRLSSGPGPAPVHVETHCGTIEQRHVTSVGIVWCFDRPATRERIGRYGYADTMVEAAGAVVGAVIV